VGSQCYVHIRITLDPSFVDNTYGVNQSAGWNPRRPHTFYPDLVRSDHLELLLTDGAGATSTSFKMDYISPDMMATCGYASQGTKVGCTYCDGLVETYPPGYTDSSFILGVTTSLTRDLNYCGIPCNYTVDSPAVGTQPLWDYRVVYETWIDLKAFGTA